MALIDVQENTFLSMIDHVFLPRYLSQDNNSDELHRVEVCMLMLMCETIDAIEEQLMPEIVRKCFDKLIQLYVSVKIDPIKLSTQIKELQPNEMIGVYVRNANCSMLIKKSPLNNEVTLAAFPVNLTGKQVYGDGNGRNINGDIQVDYPTRAISVEMNDLISSDAFAVLICHLHEANVNQETADISKYVSQWLIGAASNHASQVAADFPIISKKMRDEPGPKFRRSGFWITIKAFLQIGLTIALGESHGKFVYKLIMLKFMAAMCNRLTNYPEKSADTVDTAIEMIAKVARRIEKLPNLPDVTDYTQLAAEVKTEATEYISKVRQFVQKEQNKLHTSEMKPTKPLKRLKFIDHVVHELSPEFVAYMELRKRANYREPVKDETPEVSAIITFDPSAPPIVSQIRKLRNDNLEETLRVLCDVENWVLTYLGVTQDVLYLRELAIEYLAKARHFYRNEPVGYSRMILTMLKMIQTLDSIAREEHPILDEHRPCISSQMFSSLLMTSRHHLEVLHKLQKYFDKRQKALYPGLLEEDQITPDSFAARFAQKDEEMQDVKAAIEDLNKTKIREKLREVREARKKVGQLRVRAQKIPCVCDTMGERCCGRCKLQKKIDDYRVAVHRTLLMTEEHDQNAILFELRIPDAIACLRDVLYTFVSHLPSSAVQSRKCVAWDKHHDLSKFSTGNAMHVFLGTTCNLSIKHTKRSAKYFKHPDEADGAFIDTDTRDYNFLMCGKVHEAEPEISSMSFRNTLACLNQPNIARAPLRVPANTNINKTLATYISATKMPTKTKNQSIKGFVTLGVEKSSVYASLQWTLESTTHTQNQVLSKQFECPADLSTIEYINFGSLRADGHRLQYRNLYRAISDEGLSFETPSVLSLVMQTLWEAGPQPARPRPAKWYRETNVDLVELDFVRAMMDLLTEYIQKQQENWKNPYKLMVATLIMCRMFEINSDEATAARLATCLLKFRGYAIKWVQKIEETMEHCNGTEREPLHSNLMDAAICGIFTYFVSQNHQHFDMIFGNSGKISAVFLWLFFIECINHNNLLCMNSPQRETQELLLRIVYTIGLNVERKMRESIVNERKAVEKFVHIRYPNCALNELRLSQTKRHIIEVETTFEDSAAKIQIDYVFGAFLVNGIPIGRLPKTITGHPVFQRVFGNITFEVQPFCKAFHTVALFNDSRYIFREDKGDGVIIIEHTGEVERIKELIPHGKLIGVYPFSLIKNFSHWFNRERNTIEFRPRLFSDADFASADGIQYEFDLESRLLKHMSSERLLLDVRSKSFQTISELLKRLERSDYITVLMDAPLIARIELVRMKLTFIIDCSKIRMKYDTQSVEYKDMRVSSKQNIGTLFGLRFGLVLESTTKNANERLLIVPHGKFSVTQSGRHVDVENKDESRALRTPPFFIYHVDNVCKVLRANSFAAWFYLARLHAVTSYPLSDPFTGMTGVERALQILQSSFVWSSAPYDDESFKELLSLADLSPVRRLQTNLSVPGEIHQSISWPPNIRIHAAQDAFVLIVQKLIADSMRLAQLYTPNERETTPITNTLSSLNARSHARHVPYAPNCHISESFFKCDNRLTHPTTEELDPNMTNVRELAAHYSRSEFHVPPLNVGDLILEMFAQEERLTGLGKGDENSSVLDFCFQPSFANLWLRLYECIRLQRLSSEQSHMILTLLAFTHGELQQQLQILQAIAANAAKFSQCVPPNFESYTAVDRFEFDGETVEKMIDSAATPFHAVIATCRESFRVNISEPMLRTMYDEDIRRFKEQLIPQVASQWPCERIDVTQLRMHHSNYVRIDGACEKLNQLLEKWFRNRKLVEFTQNIDEIFATELRELSSPSFDDQPQWEARDVGTQPFPKYAIDFDTKMCSNYPQYPDEIATAQRIFVENEKEEMTLDKYWEQFRQISTSEGDMHLVDAELYPRLVPTTVLPRILRPANAEQNFLIGALAVVMCREQHTMRCDDANPLHENWKPQEHPEWLLFQIDAGFSIRRIQAEIAVRMIHPPDNKHSVMQLNMGEGKTSVIVPIVAAELANGQQLCTVTVLRHLFQTNLRSLRQCVGGMLQRRVYTMPCRRDMDIDSIADRIKDIFEECKLERGILLTLPEYRLSLQLKIYDSARKKLVEPARKLLQLHNWLNASSRHILDESDAILQPNFQMIYTCGIPLMPDGGELRWTCVQAVLKRVPFHMNRLSKQFHQKIEFNENYVCDGIDYGQGDVDDESNSTNSRTEVFRPCRLIDPEVYEHLQKGLVEDFLNGRLESIQFPEMTPALGHLVRDVLLDETLTAEQLNKYLIQLKGAPEPTILIMCGLLKFGVLKMALTKRWRVQYGRNVHGSRRMAVPYKAKDVAAEMTEFGHPDVAICLTQLAYYYSGLSDAELMETFQLLARTDTRENVYDEWIKAVPIDLVDESISTYSGVNLSDAKQRDKQLFPLLRRNMHVIDYWLSHVVYPREAKIYESKLTCTAWDLCTDQLAHPVTGFSGTNDTKLLLPMPIEQNDLPELQQTNQHVLDILWREENDQYQHLSSNISGLDILKKLTDSGIPVLLDAGAMILELNNEQVAREWLKLAPADYDAAIYFSANDILLTIDRQGFITEFEYSVYREKLDRCVVYLDDVHTRGTDLKFPSNTRACVTLSGGITRDKTVQACMRMRKLGDGHQISFWASCEADIRIRELCGKSDSQQPTTRDVTNYICQNSCKYVEDGMSYWLNASLNYAQKWAAHKYLELNKEQLSMPELLQQLGERCSDPEFVKLKVMYGTKTNVLLADDARIKFLSVKRPYNNIKEIYYSMRNDIEDKVVDRLLEHAADVVRCAKVLDDEYEKELELESELELIRQVDRPLTRKPYAPNINRKLKAFFGQTDSRWQFFEQLKEDGTILPLPCALQNAKLYSLIQPELNAWDDNLWVTKDFLSVVQLNEGDTDDEYWRPVWWIVRIDADEQQQRRTDTFILISPFECNALIPEFRHQRSVQNSTLHMFSAKLAQLQRTLINDKALQVPVRSEAPAIPLKTLVQLSMFAGSQYFENDDEQSAYCSFMGIIPEPRTSDQKRALASGHITTSGFVPQEYREGFPHLTCRFQENPEKIAVGIMHNRRNAFSRKRSHVGQILSTAKRFKFE